MKKSVYSIVLMDDVIKAVDEQAYRLGTSRSNLINQILAEHLSCVTPEMRMREVFDSVEELISESFQIQQQRSASLMTLKTALEYKYRPTINYKVELERIPDKYFGEIRVQIRTQSAPLISLFNNFFVWLINLEKKRLSELDCNCYSCTLTSGCFTRKLINSTQNEVKAGEAISGYLTLLDRLVQTYFAAPNDFPEEAAANEYNKFTEKLII